MFLHYMCPAGCPLEVLNLRCVFGARVMFVPDVKKVDPCLDVAARWLPDDATNKPASLAALYKREQAKGQEQVGQEQQLAAAVQAADDQMQQAPVPGAPVADAPMQDAVVQNPPQEGEPPAPENPNFPNVQEVVARASEAS